MFIGVTYVLCTNDQDNPSMAVNYSNNKYYQTEDF